MLNLKNRFLLVICLLIIYTWFGVSCNDNDGGNDLDSGDGEKIQNNLKDQQEAAVDNSEHVNTEAAINNNHGNNDLIFEESGDKDELLAEQMIRLSEKIKQAQGVPDEKLDNLKNSESSNVHVDSTSQVKNKKQMDRISRSQDSKQKQREQNIPDVDNDDIKRFEGVDNTQEDKILNKNVKETVTDQLKKIEEKVKSGEINVPLAEVSDDIDEEDFPYDETIDSSEEQHKFVSAQTLASTIHNTNPPHSSILPHKTQVLDAASYKTADQVEADKTVVREFSTVNELKPSSVHTFSHTEHPSVNSPDTVNVDTTKGTRAKQGNRIKKFKESLKQDQIVQDLQGTIDTLKASTVLKDETIMKQHDVVYTQATDMLSSQDINVDKKIQDAKAAQYSGTAQDQELQTASIQHSSILPSREMQKTEVRHQAARQPETDDRVPSENEQNIPKSTEFPVRDKGIPEVQETAIDGETHSGVGRQEDPPKTEEQSEADKVKMEQAQKYFEEGEKLVNNSYKKDYLQAYEYFKLASDLGHVKSLEYLGFGHLLGDYIQLDPEKALKIFKDLSDKGLPRGQLGLGLSYSAGLAVNSSQAKALIYFTFSALGGDSLAQMVLGYRYLSGIGVESKCETALQYYRKVATTVAENTSSGGPVIQRVRLFDQAENKDNGAASLMDADLLQYYEFLADKGDVQAQVVLGQLYYQGGRGVPVSHERAHHYFSMAAESGNTNSQAFLGRMHSEGSPVISQEPKLAYQYFKRAAEKGNPIGQCGLGVAHLYGNGVEKDYSKALKYFTQSADQGWSDGQLHLGIMHFSGKGVKRDYKMAVKYFNLASQGGHVLAFYHLAQMHATGTGVLRNCHTAVELYKNVAERGHWASKLMEAHQLYKEGSVNEALLKYTFLAELGYEVAQTNVAYILDQGESSLFDQKETYQRALLHWTRAASQGSTIARLKMGDYHYYGYGTDIDYESAATHYRLATEQQHNAQAMFNLGYMHENGLGLKQDVHLAKRFYDMAAETSVDAYIPVSLALVKLGLFYGADVFNKELESYYTIINRLDPRYQLGPNWDIFLSTFLAIVLGIIIILRRQR